MVTGDGEDGIHLRRLPVKMYRQQHPRTRSNRALDCIRVDVVGPRVGFHRHRCCPAGTHCKPCCNERIGRHDHLVVFPDTHGHKGEMQRIQPVCHTETESSTDVAGECRFEALEFLAQYVTPATDHACQGTVELAVELSRGRREIEERDLQRSHRLMWFQRNGRSSSPAAREMRVTCRRGASSGPEFRVGERRFSFIKPSLSRDRVSPDNPTLSRRDAAPRREPVATADSVSLYGSQEMKAGGTE